MRLWLAFHDDGIYWPDEIYQSLEPAHRVVFGFGMLPWEFVEGARNWTLPGVIAVPFKVAELLQLPRPAGYLALTRVSLCFAGITAVFFSYRLSRRLGASQVAAVAGASLLALGAVAIYFAPRALGETVSMLPVAAGFALALPRGDRRWRLLGVALLASRCFCVFKTASSAWHCSLRSWSAAATAKVSRQRCCWPAPEWPTVPSIC